MYLLSSTEENVTEALSVVCMFWIWATSFTAQQDQAPFNNPINTALVGLLIILRRHLTLEEFPG